MPSFLVLLNTINFDLSLTCTPPNFNDCDSCETFNTYRNDYSSINKNCPCK